jgi:superfamily II DNA or RNA helicase
MRLRKHQAEVKGAVDAIIGGADIRTILALVTPGGGKSLLPPIAGKLIIAGLADGIAWVVPRKSLQYQAETNFMDPAVRQLLGYELAIRSSTNDPDPCRGLDGFATTYQAIGLDEKKTVESCFKQKRMILVLDEYHHAVMLGMWHKALDALVTTAAYCLFMTGTLERGDGEPVAWTAYRAVSGGSVPAPDADPSVRVVRYTRADALEERAILPAHFFFHDGRLAWLEAGTEVEHQSLLDVPKDETSKALYTAIDTDYAYQLMDKAWEHWQAYRQVNQNARLLVVTAGIKWARRALDHIKRKLARVDIATSHESAAAHQAIKHLKSGRLDALVSIAMVYEGLDVPAASHIVCLTHIRSRPWIEQMIARAVRVDYQAGIPYEYQYAYIFGPEDKKFVGIVAKIQAEQAPFLRRRPKRQASLFDGRVTGDPPLDTDQFSHLGIVPLASSLTGGRAQVLGNGGPPEPEIQTPSEIEGNLRQLIENHIRRYSAYNRRIEKSVNASVKAELGKSRSDMTIGELRDCLSYVQRSFQIRYGRSIGTRKARRYYGEKLGEY